MSGKRLNRTVRKKDQAEMANHLAEEMRCDEHEISGVDILDYLSICGYKLVDESKHDEVSAVYFRSIVAASESIR